MGGRRLELGNKISDSLIVPKLRSDPKVIALYTGFLETIGNASAYFLLVSINGCAVYMAITRLNGK